MSDIKRMTVPELHAAFKAQNVSGPEHLACKCVICGTIQSIDDFMRATGKPFAEVEKYFGFSCVGRVTGAGAHKRGVAPGKGCNWSLGGLLRLHQLVIVDEEGKEHPYFELATPEEAQAHEASKPKVAA